MSIYESTLVHTDDHVKEMIQEILESSIEIEWEGGEPVIKGRDKALELIMERFEAEIRPYRR